MQRQRERQAAIAAQHAAEVHHPRPALPSESEAATAMVEARKSLAAAIVERDRQREAAEWAGKAAQAGVASMDAAWNRLQIHDGVDDRIAAYQAQRISAGEAIDLPVELVEARSQRDESRRECEDARRAAAVLDAELQAARERFEASQKIVDENVGRVLDAFMVGEAIAMATHQARAFTHRQHIVGAIDFLRRKAPISVQQSLHDYPAGARQSTGAQRAAEAARWRETVRRLADDADTVIGQGD